MTDRNYLQTEGDINLSHARKRWAEGIADDETTAALNRDSTSFMHQALSTPCLDVVGSSDGVYIQNLAGKQYMDFHGNNVHQLGYHNTYILERVKAQLDTLAFCPRRFTNMPAIELAERLVSLTNDSLTRVLFAPGGTSAIGIALKIARFYTGKQKTIGMYDSFHGASMDSISLGGEYVFQQGLGPLMPGSVHIPPVDTYRGMWYKEDSVYGDTAYADYLEYVIQKEGDVGVLVMETIRSTVVHVHSKAYWKRVRQICDKYDVLLVLDEIPIGMGRTGKMFAYEHTGIEPDILVLGKGLGAGIMPMAAVVCKEKLHVASSISLGHFTHEKSPLGAASALAAFDFMEQRDVLGHVNEMGIYFQERLLALKDKYQIIGDVRGVGLLWAMEVVRDRETREKDTMAAERMMYLCLERGLSLKVSDGSTLSLYPPLIISKQELDIALGILERSLIDVMGDNISAR
ncbi:aspartate aminotransferase family protein [Sphingobacterium sp. SGR-19]|uniref:(R)-1-hydroxy-2-aminoethylphosphonate ammonia-lyase n=1 Tax=Sphingobacterium sp. SGR-19 TaxID=2710886 RepID=UPI0013EE14C1|nr:aspartate aminotransferase family protein [Sphingobacterium sp. SGR-19]NGM64107.1 aspartate aminotransferase family protein [Sphingobacterium sp. SGR-19]